VKDELAFASLGVADAADAWSSGKFPAFQLEPEPPVQPAMESAPPPPPMLPDVQWGFDEAQIETASKAADAPPKKLPPPPVPIPRSVTQTQTRRTPPKFTRPEPKKSRGAPVFLIIVLLIIGGAAFGAWWYWKQLNAEPLPTEVVRPVRKPPVNVTPIPPPAPVPAPVPVPAPQPVIAQPIAPPPVPVPVPATVPVSAT